jgi:hypothetical protein
MAHLSPSDFDRLEHAVEAGRRISIVRQGRELVIVPTRLFQRDGRETIEARHPVSGVLLTLRIDDLDAIEVIP